MLEALRAPGRATAPDRQERDKDGSRKHTAWIFRPLPLHVTLTQVFLQPLEVS